MGTTATFNIPYPDPTDLLKNGAASIEDLATALDTLLGPQINPPILRATKNGDSPMPAAESSGYGNPVPNWTIAENRGGFTQPDSTGFAVPMAGLYLLDFQGYYTSADLKGGVFNDRATGTYRNFAIDRDDVASTSTEGVITGSAVMRLGATAVIEVRVSVLGGSGTGTAVIKGAPYVGVLNVCYLGR